MARHIKGSYEPWDVKEFPNQSFEINGKSYEQKLCMKDVELGVTERVPGKGNKGIRYRRTKRTLQLKEVRLLRKDAGQTSIVTSRTDLKAEEVVELQLRRWGDQENSFKYLIKEYDLDSLWVYGSEVIEGDLDHPHPDRTQLNKELNRLVEQRKNLLDRLWRTLKPQTS